MSLRSAGAALSLALGAVTVVPAPAAADTEHVLRMTYVVDLLVDDAHGHVYVTGGNDDGVVVRDLDGAPVTVVADQPGAHEMALSPDGGTLYVALADADAISAIDTTTLTETARYATGPETCPTTLAVAGTRIWFGYGCAGGHVGFLELGGVAPVVSLTAAPDTGWPNPPMVKISPAAPDRMITGAPGITPAHVQLFAISGDTLTMVTWREVGSNLGEIALTPDGQHVVTAAGQPYEHPRYRTSDLSSDGVYAGHPYPNAVAIAPNGLVALGMFSYASTDVSVYSPAGALRRRHELDRPDSTGRSLFTSALGLSADGTRMYTISGGGVPVAGQFLQVHHNPALSLSAIPLARPAAPRVRSSFTIAGKLTGTVPVKPGTVVHVSRTSKRGTVTRPDVTTGANGAFTVTDTVRKRGAYTYTVSWDGDADHLPATKTLTVTVRGLTPSMSLVTNAATYDYGSTARVLARLGTTATNRRLTVTATPLDRPVRTLAGGAVNADGYLRTTHVPSRRTRYAATFAGDDVYEPRTVYATVRVRPRVTQRLSGQYATSGGYALYRRAADPVLTTTVRPASNACVEVLVERYRSDSWRTVAELRCVAMDDAGVAITKLTGDPMAGVPYRVRSRFAGGTYHLPASSAYAYLRFT